MNKVIIKLEDNKKEIIIYYCNERGILFGKNYSRIEIFDNVTSKFRMSYLDTNDSF